jgi:hypothetical protein
VRGLPGSFVEHPVALADPFPQSVWLLTEVNTDPVSRSRACSPGTLGSRDDAGGSGPWIGAAADELGCSQDASGLLPCPHECSVSSEMACATMYGNIGLAWKRSGQVLRPQGQRVGLAGFDTHRAWNIQKPALSD